MWFQHDGVPAHFSLAIREHLHQTFGERWIGRVSPTPWPPRAPDLTPLDFFLLGHMKNLVYETPVEFEKDLHSAIKWKPHGETASRQMGADNNYVGPLRRKEDTRQAKEEMSRLTEIRRSSMVQCRPQQERVKGVSVRTQKKK
ncbi:hypothetical protein ANN_21196 [Periplaneta americana]|uniref:Uncharacterized protein n=1 Tax=Periplaneta americana TaxID=6978 RepID=A0ABQ8SEZ9_PERAM|nr:hypothetical protein ANN_21196 [Periplaneta americana]